MFVLEDKGLPLNREETDVAHRKMAVYKETKGHPPSHVWMGCLILTCYLGEPKGAFDCWASVL